MSETKPCPFCAEDIKAEAVKCRFCGEFLEEKAAEITRVDNKSNVDTVVCSKCNGHVVPSVHLVNAPIFGKFKYAVSQHLCPNCGHLIRQEGGEWRLITKVLMYAVGFWLFLVFVVLLFE